LALHEPASTQELHPLIWLARRCTRPRTDEADWLSERFDAERSRLVALAHRMLGSRDDAEDAVQESWMRLTRTDHAAVENLGGWLTTVVSRVCLDQLRARRIRDSQPLGTAFPDQRGDPAPGADPDRIDPEQSGPEQQALLASSWSVPRPQPGSWRAARGGACAGRRQPRTPTAPVRRAWSRRFLDASRRGDFGGLLALLDPDVVLRADETAAKIGVAAELRGAAGVAAFSRRAGGAVAALVNGEPGAVWMPGGRPRVVFSFTTGGGTISGIGLTADRDSLAEIDLVVLEDSSSPGWLQ
jgi:hypothetical protein